MKIRYFFLILALFSTSLLAQKHLFQDAQMRLNRGELRPSGPPPTLVYVEQLRYQNDGSLVEEFPIRSSKRGGGLDVVGYHSARHSLFWVHATGTMLKLDLWYGPISMRSSTTAFASALEAGTINLPFPTEFPIRLDRKVGYDSTDPVNNPVEVYVIQSPPPRTVDGITITAYYFPRQSLYWLHREGGLAGFNHWYGPFALGQHSQQPLELFVRLNKSNFRIGENIGIQVVVKNNSNVPQTLRFSSGLQGDYQIDSTFQYSQNRVFTQALTQVSVPAYAEATILNYKHSRRDYPLSPGRHSIIGLANPMGPGAIRSEPVIFSVTGGINVNNDDAMTKAVDLITKQRYAEAIILLLRVVGNEPNNEIAYYNLACAYSLSNQIDKAIDALENAFRTGYNDYSHVWLDSDLGNIHNHPRFKRLLKQYDPNR